jgi:nitroreductase
MEFDEVVRRRRMVRDFDPDRTLPLDTVNALLGTAIRAPSAGFSLGWQFLVLHDPADRMRYWQVCVPADADPNPWLTGLQNAPVLVLALSDKQVYLDRYSEPDKGRTDRSEADWPVPYWDIDTGMASLLILLGAVDRGLSGCFFGVPVDRHAAVRDAFGIGAGLRVVGVIALGHGAPDRRSPSLRRGRRPLSDVVSFGRMGRRG